MDGGDLVSGKIAAFPLPFITAVVDTLRVSVLLQRLIAEPRPCRPPLLGFGLLVPIGSGNGFTFVLPLFRGIDFIPVFIHQPKKGSILSAAVSFDFVKVHAAERNKN